MDMSEDTVADLKQFIAGLVGQQLAGLREDFRNDILNLETSLHEDIVRVEKKVDDLSSSVADAIDAANEITQEQIKNHERRIVRLENKVA